MICKVCKKELFIELDFRTIFRFNYSVHEKCKKYLDRVVKTEVIPIQNNTIVWIYFYEKEMSFDTMFVEMYLIGKGIEYCQEFKEWSIVVWMTQDEYQKLDTLTQYLFLMLGDQSIVFLSLIRDM